MRANRSTLLVALYFVLTALRPNVIAAEDVYFADLFKLAKERPIKKAIVILASPGDTLVLRASEEFVLDGLGLFVSADTLRVEGDAEIRSFNGAAAQKPGTGPKGSDGANRGGAADPANGGAPGGDAGQGDPGTIGNEGAAASLVRFEVNEWLGNGKLVVKNVGQKGGPGQQGGTGGTGGQGQKGGQGKSRIADCESGGGGGGQGGRGGPGGIGGKGGVGGRGGQVVLSGAAIGAHDRGTLVVLVDGGPGGDGGPAGGGGTGGQGGQGGDGSGHCGGGGPGPNGPGGGGGQTGPEGDKGAPGAIKRVSEP